MLFVRLFSREGSFINTGASFLAQSSAISFLTREYENTCNSVALDKSFTVPERCSESKVTAYAHDL